MRKDPREDREAEGLELAQETDGHACVDCEAPAVKAGSDNRARDADRRVTRELRGVAEEERRVVREHREGHEHEADIAGQRLTRVAIHAECRDPRPQSTKRTE